MHSYEKCLIDNWSLQRAATVIENEISVTYPYDSTTINTLGGLSNFINAILLYDEIQFLPNGNQTSWYRYDWFQQNVRPYINPAMPPDDYPLGSWASRFYSSDYGVSQYVELSKILKADLLISSERADKIKTEGLNTNNLEVYLKKIDSEIKTENSKSEILETRLGVNHNFIFPSLTHYVLSEATSRDDLLKVIFEVKTSGIVDSLKNKIKEVTLDLKDVSKFRIEIDNILKQHLGYKTNEEKPWSLKFSVLSLSISKSFNLKFITQKSYLTFLKDIIACRTETYGLREDIERIFGKK